MMYTTRRHLPKKMCLTIFIFFTPIVGMQKLQSALGLATVPTVAQHTELTKNILFEKLSADSRWLQSVSDRLGIDQQGDPKTQIAKVAIVLAAAYLWFGGPDFWIHELLAYILIANMRALSNASIKDIPFWIFYPTILTMVYLLSLGSRGNLTSTFLPWLLAQYPYILLGIRARGIRENF